MKAHTLMLALLVGCTGEPKDTASPVDTDSPVDTGDTDTPTDTADTGDTGDTGDTATTLDADGDGDPAIEDGGTDCDDDDQTVHPGAKESCDDIDSDCDGDLVDGFADLDRDAVPDCVDSDACASPPAGLLVWLQGDDLTDTMGTASLSGGASASAGIVGNALAFTGQNGLYDAAPDAWLVSPISVEAWVSTTKTGDSQTILAHYECGGECNTDGPSPSAYILRIDSKGSVVWYVRDADTPNGVDGELVTGRTDVADGLWHHVLAVLDPAAGELALYVDGELDYPAYSLVNSDGSGFAQDALDDTDPITIGYNRSAGSGEVSSVLTGLIDELSVYSAALTEADARALHGAGIAGKCE